jgi:hypothetical protein
LALPGLFLGAVTFVVPEVSDSGPNAGGLGLDYMLWGLLRLMGFAGLVILGLAGTVAFM